MQLTLQLFTYWLIIHHTEPSVRTYLFLKSTTMKLDKFLGSKTKVDILKYLIFRRQGISIRALEHEIPWTFPAIKKQVDSLEESEIVDIDKEGNKWSIVIRPSVAEHMRNLLLYCLSEELKVLFTKYEYIIESYYLGKIFGNALDLDMVIIYKNCEKALLDVVKEDISNIFRGFFIETAQVSFMSIEEFQRRYRLADKFVLNLMRTKSELN